MGAMSALNVGYVDMGTLLNHHLPLFIITAILIYQFKIKHFAQIRSASFGGLITVATLSAVVLSFALYYQKMGQANTFCGNILILSSIIYQWILKHQWMSDNFTNIRRYAASCLVDVLSILLCSALYIAIITDRKEKFLVICLVIAVFYQSIVRFKLDLVTVLSFTFNLSIVLVLVLYLVYVAMKVSILLNSYRLKSQNILFVVSVLSVYHYIWTNEHEESGSGTDADMDDVFSSKNADKVDIFISKDETDTTHSCQFQRTRRNTARRLSVSIMDLGASNVRRISRFSRRVSVSIGKVVNVSSISISKVLGRSERRVSVSYSSYHVWLKHLRALIYNVFFIFVSFYLSLIAIVSISAWYIGSDGFTIEEVSTFYKEKVMSKLPMFVEANFSRFNSLVAWVCFLTVIRKGYDKWWRTTVYGFVDANIPGPEAWPLVGNILQAIPIKAAGLFTFNEWAKQWPVMFNYKVSSFFSIVYVHHPEAARQLLSVNIPKERKYVYRFLEAYTGEGLIVASSPKWNKHRRVVGPAFHYLSVKGYKNTISEACDTFNDTIGSLQGRSVDAFTLCGVFAMDVLLRCMFSLPGDWQHDNSVSNFVGCVSRCVQLMSDRIYNPLYYSDTMYSWFPAGRKFRETVNEARRFSSHIINRKVKKWDITSQDIISNILKEMKYSEIDVDKDNDLTINDLVDEVTTFLFAGHDTSASALAFAMGLLGKNKSSQIRCIQEAKEFMKLKGSEEFSEESCPFITQVVKETLRLYPAVPMVARRLDRPLTVCGIPFPTDSWFCINFYSLHRHSEFWSNPNDFNPERFDPENINKIAPFSYLPFSGGPRNCIGQKFAKMTVTLGLIKTLSQFEVICDEFGQAETEIVLHPVGMKLSFKRHS